ncbi:MAG TPA: hypothetical protein VI306_18760 [Pyrinomonadaceae bacterium]
MKSYFAKLADRATLGNVTAPSAAHAPRVSDPFDETAPPQTPLPALNNKSHVPPAREAISPVVDSQLVQRAAPKVESHQPEPVELPSEISTLQPRPREEREVTERIQAVEQVVEKPKAATTKPATQKEEVEPPQLVPNQITNFNPPQSKSAEKDQERNSENNDDSIAELQREQALLLRKADLFMSSLFEAQRESQSATEKEVEQSENQVAKLERESPKRLEPTPRVQPTVTPEPEGPSLIIGQLTVEVTSPTPTPAPAQPQRVIVRGSRGRGSGVRSSQRFGLGQF